MLQGAAKILSEFVGQNDRVCIAVSGGKDSMCLLDFCCGEGGLKKENIGVVNVEHGIRGESSRKDSKFVENRCNRRGIAFHGYCIDVPALAAQSGQSLETAAREARYRIFESVAREHGYRFVLTAHHALDNAETVLMHMFRGSGVDGLRGMEVLSRGFVLRPFLTTEKSDIDEYAAYRKIEFVTDETNGDDKYNRNFLRNVVMPLILSRWGGAVKAVNALSEQAGALVDYADSQMDFSLVEAGGERVRIDLSAFADEALAPRYVRLALKKAGLVCDFERKHIEAIVGISGGGTGAAVDLPHGYRAEKTYGAVEIFQPFESFKYGKEDCEEVEFRLGETQFCGQTIVAERVDKADFGQSGTLYLDGTKIPHGAKIRLRRDGDRFRPYGGGEKKLKEYFIDKKIPKAKRDALALLCDGGRVLAVLGVQISDDVKIENEKNVIKISIKG